jgi:hypothetical protein
VELSGGKGVLEGLKVARFAGWGRRRREPVWTQKEGFEQKGQRKDNPEAQRARRKRRKDWEKSRRAKAGATLRGSGQAGRVGAKVSRGMLP